MVSAIQAEIAPVLHLCENIVLKVEQEIQNSKLERADNYQNFTAIASSVKSKKSKLSVGFRNFRTCFDSIECRPSPNV